MRYFAYGSNMGVAQMKERGVRFASRALAVLDGWRVEFNKQAARNREEGFANIVPVLHSRVEGVLFEIESEDLQKLDRYEGYPDHYTRQEITVTCEGKEATAVVYVARPDKVTDGLKPSAEYLQRIRAGSDLLAAAYCDQLLNREALD